MPLSVSVHELGECVLLQCAGKLVCGESLDVLRTIPTGPRLCCVLLDVAQIEAVDAAGLGVLAGLAQQAEASGTVIGIVNASPRLRYLLDITGLSSVLALHTALKPADCARDDSFAPVSIDSAISTRCL